MYRMEIIMKVKDDCFDSAVRMICNELCCVLLKIPDSRKHFIQEIRLRVNKPVALSNGSETLFVSNDGDIIYSPERGITCSQRNIFDTFRQLCSYSVYSKQNEIKNGYITVNGGHRIGLCGTASIKEGKISSVTDITSLNIRIARQIFGAAQNLMPIITPLKGGVLIAGLPSTGKTTLLRDIAYRLSKGIGCHIMRTSVVDERGEISGGNNFNCIDLGYCDILRGYPKGEGIMQSIRALSPQVIICDEVGTEEDVQSIALGANAGAYIIATIHADNYLGLMRRKQACKLIETEAFSTLIFLSSSDKPCTFTEIINLSERRIAI